MLNALGMLSKLSKQTLLLAILLFVSCAKKRDEKFAQGQGQDLQKVEDLHNKKFKLKTKEALGASAGNSALHTEISSQQFDFYSYPIVSYESDSKLLGDIVFKGKTNTEYELLYRLEDNYLKIYKVADKKLIPTEEHPYAEKIDVVEASQLAIPLVGYPIKGYYDVENAKNSADENTNILLEMPKNGFQNSGFVKIDYLARQIFRAFDTKDIFPSKYFNGEWFYSAAVTETKDIRDDENSDTISLLKGASLTQTRIKLVADNEKYLEVRNSAIPSVLKKTTNNLPVLATIPTQWLDLKSESLGRHNGLVGTQANDKEWKRKPYISLALSDITSLNGIDSELGSRKVLSDLVVQDDYWSVTIQFPETGYQVKHSFLRMENRTPYTPRAYTKKDSKRFGFWTSGIKPEKLAHIWRERESEASVLITRFNPQLKAVVYHFRIGTPERFRQFGRKMIAIWNSAFNKIGKDNWIQLDESVDAQLGDSRYNILNLNWAHSDGGNIVGYGPPFIDPINGEIIASTANIYVSSIFDSLVSQVRGYVFRKQHEEIDDRLEKWMLPLKGIVSTEFFSDDAKIAAIKNKNMGTEVSAVANSYNLKASSRLFSHDVDYDLLRKDFPNDIAFDGKVFPLPKVKFLEELLIENKIIKKQKNEDKITPFTTCEASIKMNSEIKDIEENCPEIVDYAKSLKEGKESSTTERELFEACADKLLEKPTIATGIHEFGHNIGLTHNFQASTDSKNFYTKEESGTNEQIKTSSVMDYLANGALELSDRVGKYDLAAIRFGYTDNKEESNNPTYAFCNDYDVYFGNNVLCDRFDEGASVKEITENAISDYFLSLSLTRKRYDRTFFHPEYATMGRVLGPVVKLLKIYGEYRYELSKSVLVNKGYFQGITSENYQKDFLDRLKEEIDKEKALNSYSKLEDLWKASKIIERFFTEVAFLPEHFCLINNNDPILPADELISFAQIKDEMSYKYKSNLESCNDPSVKTYLKETGRTLLNEFGYDVKEFRLHNRDYESPSENADYDVAGVETDRKIAAFALSVRMVSSYKNLEDGFFPALLDDPQFRYELQLKLWSRIILGLDTEGGPPNIAPLISTNNKSQGEERSSAAHTLRKLEGLGKSFTFKKPNYEKLSGSKIADAFSSYQKATFKVFKSEQNILYSLMSSFNNSFSVPGSLPESIARLLPFRIELTRDELRIDRVKDDPDMIFVSLEPFGTAYASFYDKPFTALLLKKYSLINNNKKITRLTQSELEALLFTPIDQSTGNKSSWMDLKNQSESISAFFDQNAFGRFIAKYPKAIRNNSDDPRATEYEKERKARVKELTSMSVKVFSSLKDLNVKKLEAEKLLLNLSKEKAKKEVNFSTDIFEQLAQMPLNSEEAKTAFDKETLEALAKYKASLDHITTMNKNELKPFFYEFNRNQITTQRHSAESDVQEDLLFNLILGGPR